MLQAYVSNVLSVSNVCCIRVFHVVNADCWCWCPWGRAGPSHGHRHVDEVQACRRGMGRRHRPRGAVVEETGASLPSGLEKTAAEPMWKRRGRVIRWAWAADLKRAVRMRARKTELARVARKSKWTVQRSHGRPDIRALVLPKLLWTPRPLPHSITVSSRDYVKLEIENSNSGSPEFFLSGSPN
jgi:hypothetical protein